MNNKIHYLKISWILPPVLATLLIAGSGCTPSTDSPAGFRIPKGDVAQGQQAFAELNCIQCHTVKGVENLSSNDGPRDIHIELGGETTRVKTYGELVTSVIYPGHVIDPKYREEFTDEEGNTRMPDLTDKMTVRQMIDLVHFLQGYYDVVLPSPSYENYGYPY